ncbi:lysosomal Pro-X carboxypeptidase-like [Cucurbita pepo subsp. pepo]|uniref:lysosomal Pro-X carboxypeptidase-like n=1 Tax=Cucurbita pepo subsp. pepo TaxID=3664 RepID=UPI000C9D4CBA|nr:lysosomal Pro-X carboxypeptidase-like [Cucurbita pepo subsp. pepo]
MMLLPCLLLILSACVSATQYRIPRLSPTDRDSEALFSPLSDDFKTFYYNQTLDHFNYRPESYTTFAHRYIINFKYWGGANSSAPILAYLGAEGPLDNDLNVVGFSTDNAAQFGALLVYIEHRYYGKSIPFGSREVALKNASTLGYFNSAQAIADYADVLIHVKKELHAKDSPVIVLGGSYGGTQYDHPPRYPVTIICDAIDGASPGSGIVDRIAAGVFAYKGNLSCYMNQARDETETDVGWRWQRCSEMVMPLSTGNDTMFPAYNFELGSFIDYCNELYGVSPRPHWVTTYYGGHDIKLILKRFGSNIIFSNGLRDPYSSGGVLHDLSDSLLALHTPNGSHCLDILRANETDPQWLVEQRETEVNIIKGWIIKYYADLGSPNNI